MAPFGDQPAVAHIDSVAPWRTGLVANGRIQMPGRGPASDLAAILLSETGEAWRAVPIEAGVAADDASEIRLLVAGPGGAVAFGGTCCDIEADAVWYSSSGANWEMLESASVFEDSGVAAARPMANGFVAVGGSNAGRAAVWTSNNGRDWTAARTTTGGLGRGAINDVAKVAGRWLAVGRQDDGPTYDGALWESPDGITWRPLRAPDMFRGERDTVLERLYPTRTGVLLIGNDGPHEDRVQCELLTGRTASLAAGLPVTAQSCGWGVETHWWSADGRSWKRLPPVAWRLASEVPSGPGPAEFRLITAGGPGLVNLGEDLAGGIRLYGSRDGQTWKEIDQLDGVRPSDSMSGMTVLDGRVIAVGQAWDGRSSGAFEPAVWIGPGI
jgi:hypothetical protein